MSRPLFALAADLLFAARIRSTAEAAGASLQLTRSAADLVARVRESGGGRVLLDLEVRGLDIAGTVAALREGEAEIVAFVSHVRSDLIDRARAAGAHRVMARSAFVRELPALVVDDPPPAA